MGTYRDGSNNIVNVTGFKALFQLRSNYDPTSPPLIECRSSDGYFTFDGVNTNNVKLVVPASETGKLTAGKLPYAIYLKNTTGIFPFLEGEIEVMESAIKAEITW
jgi:hypothetical protein